MAVSGGVVGAMMGKGIEGVSSAIGDFCESVVEAAIAAAVSGITIDTTHHDESVPHSTSET